MMMNDKRYVLYNGFTLGTMVSAGQVSVIITTSLFLYYTGLEVFCLYKKKFYFKFLLLVSFREAT